MIRHSMHIGRRQAMLFAGGAASAALFAGPALAAAGAAQLYGPADPSTKRGGHLTVGSLVEPPGLDPFHQAADARIQVSVLMYQGLVHAGQNSRPQLALAESMAVTPDGKAYTFTLHRNVKFHTGAAMTSADVKYSYDYIRDPKNGSPGAADFQVIESVEAPEPYTVVFHLSQPDAAFPLTVSDKFGGVVPSGYFSSQAASARMNQQSVGTGPFRLSGFRPNSFLKLERFKDYWQADTPYLDQVTFLFLPNSASMLVGLENGRLDLALLSHPQDLAQIHSRPGITVKTWPSLVQKTLDLDCAMPQLRDVRVRQAIALAIDKQKVLEAAYLNYGHVLGTMVYGMQPEWGLPLAQVPFQIPDPAHARNLLQAAGHGEGFAIDLTTIVGYDWMNPAAVTVASQLSEVGIKARIRKLELGVWINNFRTHNMGFTFNDWGTMPDPDLLFYRHFHKRPQGEDFRNWNNEKGSQLLDEGRRELNLEKRQEIYRQFQAVLGETVPTLMIFGSEFIVASGKRVQNYVQHPTGWYYGLIRTSVRI